MAQILFHKRPSVADSDSFSYDEETLYDVEPLAETEHPEDISNPGLGGIFSKPTIFPSPESDTASKPLLTPFASPTEDDFELKRKGLASLIVSSQKRQRIGESLCWSLLLLGIAAGFFYILARPGILPARVKQFKTPIPAVLLEKVDGSDENSTDAGILKAIQLGGKDPNLDPDTP